jgi:hypothetical protein
MTHSDPANSNSNARFRSATEFPKTIQALPPNEAEVLYKEMRDCLVFTNRSRAQLIRWNDQHKKDKLELKQKLQNLQGMIQQLAAEKQQLTQTNQDIVSSLELEISAMAIHLDRLSDAFEPFADLENEEQAKWGFLSLPGRFFRFLEAVKSIVLWWRDGNNSAESSLPPEQPNLISGAESFGTSESLEQDRRDRPQMYTDQASQNRSLLDR